LEGWTARRREDLLKLLAELNRRLDELDEAADVGYPQIALIEGRPDFALSMNGRCHNRSHPRHLHW